jgi:hypothetical protein
VVGGCVLLKITRQLNFLERLTKMNQEFIQITATKDAEDLFFCSNLGLMDSQKIDADSALERLCILAAEYTDQGYRVDWIREQYRSIDVLEHGELFRTLV